MASPVFSVVVPVHNDRAYLRDCLASVLGQDFGDLELIVVDGASSDGSGDIADEIAAADGRVRVLHLDGRPDRGAARNAGLAHATGSYVLFVDSGDTLTDRALTAVADRLDRTGSPEILVFDHTCTDWRNHTSHDFEGGELSEQGPGAVGVAARPELLSLRPVVWNKAYRRDWLAGEGFTFAPGWHEDIAWTYPVLLAAPRVAVLDRVCYDHRQRRRSTAGPETKRSSFDVFDQYARVFAYLDGHPQHEQWRTLLFTHMITELLKIADAPAGVGSAALPEWFDRSADAYERYRPADYRPPPGAAGLEVRTLATRNYRAFAAARTGRKLSRAVGTQAHRARRITARNVWNAKRAGIRGYYWAQLTRPIDENLVVYSAYWSRSYSCNPAAIYEQARVSAPHLRGVWVVRPDRIDSLPAGVEHVELGSPEYYRVMALAKYTVNNVNFGDNIVKRPGTVHLQTNHGTPLKTMGLQLQDYPLGAANMNFRALLARCDRWDYLISSNRYSSEVWERAYPCNYETLETGYPRNDRLVRATPDDYARLRAQLGLPDGATVVLYAPTFRDWARNRFVPPFPLDELCRRLGDDHVLLVRGHYFTRRDDGLAELQRRGTVRDVSSYPVLEELMIASDVLLTDYSSIMFDYANLDRPIVIYADDWDTYRRVRGANFDLLAAPPGAVATELDALVDAFRSGRIAGAEATALRKEFRRKFCMFDDGHAAERVVRRVFLGERPAT